jgi:LuxR family maltose regulon positive regulatory protein
MPAKTLPRARLHELLDAPTAAIVTLLAPAGYGKTVAVALWALTAGHDGLWIRVRGREVDSAAFVHDLAEELLAAGLARPGGPLRHLGEAIGAGGDPWDILCRALKEAGPLVLVVDDADRLTAPAVEGLVRLVEELPGLRLRAMTRSRTALTEPGLALVVDAEVVTGEQLALTRDEARAILGARATPERLEELLAAGGSPLLARAMAEPGDEVGPRAGGAGGAFASLLKRRIESERWDPRLVHFLARTSPADELTVELATALSGDRETPAMLEQAEREGLGLWTRSPSRGELFRFAPPAREAFEALLRAEHPAEVRSLALTVARWEAGHGDFFRALARAREHQDWNLATAIVREGWPVLLRNHGSELRALFSSVSVLTLRRLPLIAMMLALVYNARHSQRLRALEFFALANYGASRQAAKAGPADRALLAGVQAAALRVSGRMSSALAAADRCYDALVSMSPADRDQLGPNEPTLFNQAGTTFFYGGRTEEALDAFARATAVGDTRGLTAGILALGMTAGVQAVSGDLTEAAVTVTEGRGRDWPEGWLTGYSGSFFQIAEAFLAIERFDVEEADRRIRLLDPHRETIEHWSLLTHLDVLVDLLRGRPGDALLRLDSTARAQSRRRGTTPFMTDRLRHTLVLAHLAYGDAVAAERALGQGGDPVRRSVSLARIALAKGLPGDALRALQPDRTPEGSSRTKAESLMLTTAALALLGDDLNTREAARAAIAFTEDRGQRLAIALVPRPALTALVDALERTDALAEAALVRSVLPHAVIDGGLDTIRLTPRETEVARRLPTGATLAEIAGDLSVSPNTVKTQLRSLYRKLGVTTRQEALARLALLGITGAGAPRSRPGPPAG